MADRRQRGDPVVAARLLLRMDGRIGAPTVEREDGIIQLRSDHLTSGLAFSVENGAGPRRRLLVPSTVPGLNTAQGRFIGKQRRHAPGMHEQYAAQFVESFRS